MNRVISFFQIVGALSLILWFVLGAARVWARIHDGPPSNKMLWALEGLQVESCLLQGLLALLMAEALKRKVP